MSEQQQEALLKLVRLTEEMDLYYMEFGKGEARPWGHFVVLEDRESHKLKRIIVYPGGKLSYQMHYKRDETWTIIRGSGAVVIDDVIQQVSAGNVVQIPAGRKHRIMNEGDDNLEFIEVQLGSYFGEDDIVRFNDDYGRV